MIKKSIVIIVPIVLVIFALFWYGVSFYNSKFQTFQEDGHVIAKDSKSTTTKYFFDSNSKYKIVDDNVVITTKDKEEATIPVDTFIHYVDGSISTFSKSVVLNLDEMSNDNYLYYNVFPGTIFVKNGSNYSLNYLDKKLNFTNFLLKISNDKFMVVGQKIKLTIGGNEKVFENTYLEISYLDGGVIKIENQASSFQSISDDVMVECAGNVIVDFVGKNIYKDQVRKLSLGEITIDSDDNIQINTEDNKLITGKKKDAEGKDGNATGGNGSTGSNGSSGGNGSNGSSSGSKNESKKYTKDELPNMSSGVVDTTVDTTEQVIDANARIKDAEFKVVNMDVTANRLRAAVQITDEAAVLEGDITIKIIEANTNKVVYENRDDSGSNMIDIENESLSPETNYILILNSDYKKNDVTYNKDFVQKTFVTDAVGVTLEKYFASENKLEVNLRKANYSEVVSVDVDLEDKDGRTLKTETINLEIGDNISEFTSLVNDTRYNVRVYNFVYQDSVVTDGFTIVKTYETLKKKPTIGTTSFSIDKKEGKINMMINNTIDPDGGITSYKYEVYDARGVDLSADSIDFSQLKLVTVIEKNTSSSASLKVDGKSVERGVPYLFRCVMTFNDNEKQYDYYSETSSVMKLDGVEFPVVKFNKTDVTFNHIIGEIEILDDGNTIDINSGSIITIIYSDSVGQTGTFTSSGSYKIPVELYNLRSNETYTFSVMTRVDLQDGNDPIDSCYIGSVIVHTEEPNPFSTNFSVSEDVTSAFTVTAQLVRGNKGPTENEANALTGISFNLYQGRNTSGKLIKTVKATDKNLAYDESDLRLDYYDKSFVINPIFFDLRNSDLTSEYYTIEITNAYDCTDYKNPLPIDNNIYTVKTLNALPDMPSNPDNSVDYIPIRNRDLAHENQRADLDESTIVGYKFRAVYNNEAKYAKTIKYYVRNMAGDILKTFTYTVPPSGEINYKELELKDGIVENLADNQLRRGQKFYITYTIDLDTNYDGVVDVTYPLSGVLKSSTIAPARQDPVFSFYPSTASADNYAWKYTYNDVDHTLVDQKVIGTLNGVNFDSKTVDITSDYKTVSFGLSQPGLFAIYGKYKYVNGNSTVDKKIVGHYYEGVNTLDFGPVAIYPEKNRVIFSFLEYPEKLDEFNKISAVKIDFVSGSSKVTLDGLSAKTGNITVNYSSIEELKGKTITPVVTIYYDSGIYGFDNESSAFAVQQIRSVETEATYYYVFGNDKFSSSDTANGSYVTFELNPKSDSLTFHDKISGGNTTRPMFIAYGLAYNDTYISPKKLYEKVPIVNGDNTFSFDSIIPGISILDESGISSINPLINTASFRLTTYGIKNQLRDDKIYVELYRALDDTASEAVLEKTVEYNLSDLVNELTIDELLPQTNYYLKVYGFIKKSDGTYEQSYLYDINQLRDGVNYYFKTIGNVGISEMHAVYKATSYTNRYIQLSYKLDKTIGYSYIKYNVYKVIDETEEVLLENVISTNDTRFKTNMVADIKIPNDSGFVTGGNYRIEAQPFLTTVVDGRETDIPLESNSVRYKFNTLYKPYFGIVPSSSTDVIQFRVNVRDYHKSIVNGKFRVQFLTSDGVDITPTNYVDKEYSIYNYNQVFTLSGVQPNSTYTFNILYNADLHNDVNNIEPLVYTYNSKTSSANGDIDLGTVYAETSMSDSTKVILRFFGSTGLSTAKSLRYSIYNENSFSIDNQVSFKPSNVTSGSTSYHEFQLPDVISNDGIYYISMQFLDGDGKIIVEETVEYHLLS